MKSAENIRMKMFHLAVFSIAMGLLEAIVVVYLRQLYYPEGFGFPLKGEIAGGLFLEYLREMATLVMLATVSLAAGRVRYERFAYFLLCFGIWDIFYYLSLKILLDWPSSPMTWDILFLIPVVWVAPVLAPVICATTMIVIALSILHYVNLGTPVRFTFMQWTLMSLGALVIFTTFIWDYSALIFGEGFAWGLIKPEDNPHTVQVITNHIPQSFGWMPFLIGEVMIVASLILFLKRMRASCARY
jgi:hypothetical protein